MLEKKLQRELEEREHYASLKRMKLEEQQKSDPVPLSPMRGEGNGTPNKSLNASFSKLAAFQSNIYGGAGGLLPNNSRINLSNYLFDHRFSNSILNLNAAQLLAGG
jgi:hypothetical protein